MPRQPTKEPLESSSVLSQSARMSKEQSIAQKFGTCIRLAGQNGEAADLLLKNWEADLSRLRPGDNRTTLKCLSAAQDVYTAAVVGKGVVAQLLQA